MKESRKNLRTLIIIIAVVVVVIVCEFIFMAVRDAGNTNEESEQTSSAVSQISPESADSAAVIAEARTLIAQEDYDEALDILTGALANDEMNVTIYQLMADAYFGLWEFSDMEEILLQGYENTGDESLHDSWIECLESVSAELLEDEDYEEAIDWIIKLVDADGTTDERMFDLGLSYYMTDEYDEAINSLEGCDTSVPEIRTLLIDAKIRYSEDCYDDNDYGEAIIQLKDVINMDPDSIEAYTLLISAYIEDGMYAEAKTYIDQGMNRFVDSGTVSVSTDYLDAFLETSSSYYAEIEDVEGGLAFWEKVIGLRPDNPLYQEELANYRSQEADESFVKGEELLDAGNPTAAETYFRQSYNLAGESLDIGIIESDSGIYCIAADGSLVTGWYEDEVGQKYYFYPIPGNGYAKAVTGWQSINNEEFYFDEDGVMVVDDYAPDGRYLGPDGKVGIDPDSIDEEDEEDFEDDEDEEEDEEEEIEDDDSDLYEEDTDDTGSGSEDEDEDNAPGVYIRNPSGNVGPGFG